MWLLGNSIASTLFYGFHGNKLKSVRIATDTLALWTITYSKIKLNWKACRPTQKDVTARDETVHGET